MVGCKVNYEGRDVEVVAEREYKGELFYRVLWLETIDAAVCLLNLIFLTAWGWTVITRY